MVEGAREGKKARFFKKIYIFSRSVLIRGFVRGTPLACEEIRMFEF